MAGKNVLIVYAHQEPKSLNGSLKDIAVTVLSKQGCRVTVSDLYTMEFEPRATRKDISGIRGSGSNTSSSAYLLCDRGVPAIMKGWMDRVLAQGFAFEFPKCYDTGFLKNKSALLSFTTGGDTENFSKAGASGDFRYLLWPLQHGVMHFCGFKVLAPQISFAPETESEERRREMLSSWAQRLETIWEEKPINCTPPWYFD